MKTPIIMLIFMTAPYLGLKLISVVRKKEMDAVAAASIGLGILFAFTGIGHFVKMDSMAQMMPEWIPSRLALVYLTGVLEFVMALGFFIPKARRVSAWVAISLLIVFFPVNIYAAFNEVPMGGHAWGPIYLLIRGPLQLIIISWIYWFLIKGNGNKVSER